MSKELEALKEIREKCGNEVLKMVWNKNREHIDITVNNNLDLIENALKDYELIKQTKIIAADKEISDEDIEKIKNQRIIIGSVEQCEIKSLFDEKKIKKLLTAIEKKQRNAESQLLGNHDLDKRERLKGEIEAYYDIVCLIKFKYGIEE